ncbi:MAG: hypothetical protein ACRDHK_12290, partial [Actinomycetota bacterium]
MPEPFPWLYPYVAERLQRRGREVLRPVIPISLPGAFPGMEPSFGLIDTGAENVFAATWLAELAGIHLTGSNDRLTIGIGGQVAEVTFVEVELRLHAARRTDEFVAWRGDVGFVPDWRAPFPLVLGQTGFLDRFTVRSTGVQPFLPSRTGRCSTSVSAPDPRTEPSRRNRDLPNGDLETVTAIAQPAFAPSRRARTSPAKRRRGVP